MNGERGIIPAQAPFWHALGGRIITRAHAEPYGVEFLTNRDRQAEIARAYPVPTIVDVGLGLFGVPVGLVYVDDETGRAVAYAPPYLLADYRLQPRQQRPCPVCGARVHLTGNTADGRYIGSCGDAFLPRQWRALGPRSPKRRDP